MRPGITGPANHAARSAKILFFATFASFARFALILTVPSARTTPSSPHQSACIRVHPQLKNT